MNIMRFIRINFSASFLTLCQLCLMLFSPLQSVAAQSQTSCLECHGGQSGRGGKVVKPWQGSVHAENGISCQDCHGGDPKDTTNAMNPARGFLGVPKEPFIPAFCGRCHVGIMDDYLQSAHGKALGSGGPTCVTCHGSHDIKKVTLELINEKSCTRCHTYVRAAEIKTAMAETEKLTGEIERQLLVFKGEGFDTDAQEKALFSARNKYHRLFHEVNTLKVIKESVSIKTDLDKILVVLRNFDAERQNRKLIGAVAVSVSLLTALLFYLMRKTYD